MAGLMANAEDEARRLVIWQNSLISDLVIAIIIALVIIQPSLKIVKESRDRLKTYRKLKPCCCR